MFHKVLVPLDGSEFAECSLPIVKNMAREGSIKEIILLTVAVIDIPHDDIGKDFDFSTYWGAQLEKSKKYLADVQAKLSKEGTKVDTVVIEVGWPAQVITNFSEQNGVDLIVITSYGNTGLKNLMFGSVALRVLHDSHIPVLLIRP
jgi:nucleotide-binding universal stress UspA family protein